MGKKSKAMIVNGKKIKSDYQKRKEKYKFNLRDDVTYIGRVYDQYFGKVGKIVTRMSPRNKVWYHVLFEDGKQLEIMEGVLEKFGDLVEIEDVEEIKEGSVEGEN